MSWRWVHIALLLCVVVSRSASLESPEQKEEAEGQDEAEAANLYHEMLGSSAPSGGSADSQQFTDGSSSSTDRTDKPTEEKKTEGSDNLADTTSNGENETSEPEQYKDVADSEYDLRMRRQYDSFTPVLHEYMMGSFGKRNPPPQSLFDFLHAASKRGGSQINLFDFLHNAKRSDQESLFNFLHGGKRNGEHGWLNFLHNTKRGGQQSLFDFLHGGKRAGQQSLFDFLHGKRNGQQRMFDFLHGRRKREVDEDYSDIDKRNPPVSMLDFLRGGKRNSQQSMFDFLHGKRHSQLNMFDFLHGGRKKRDINQGTFGYEEKRNDQLNMLDFLRGGKRNGQQSMLDFLHGKRNGQLNMFDFLHGGRTKRDISEELFDNLSNDKRNGQLNMLDFLRGGKRNSQMSLFDFLHSGKRNAQLGLLDFLHSGKRNGMGWLDFLHNEKRGGQLSMLDFLHSVGSIKPPRGYSHYSDSNPVPLMRSMGSWMSHRQKRAAKSGDDKNNDGDIEMNKRSINNDKSDSDSQTRNRRSSGIDHYSDNDRLSALYEAKLNSMIARKRYDPYTPLLHQMYFKRSGSNDDEGNDIADDNVDYNSNKRSNIMHSYGQFLMNKYKDMNARTAETKRSPVNFRSSDAYWSHPILHFPMVKKNNPWYLIQLLDKDRGKRPELVRMMKWPQKVYNQEGLPPYLPSATRRELAGKEEKR